jgi:putative peptidoglycan lipid II flippase
MAVVTFFSRLTGYLRDKALAWVLGAGLLNDAFWTAFRIPNAFRALLAEGALHAAFVPALSQLQESEEDRCEARQLVGGLLAVLLLVLAVVVGLGILCAPWLVSLYGKGFAATPGKLETTVLMSRLMFPYLALISLAALCQGILNSRERFLLSASTPIYFNLALAGVAWVVARHLEEPARLLAAGVLLGGALQFLVQIPAVIKLGHRLRPLWGLMGSPQVRQVLLLMLPGIPVLGINQLNQLVTNRFASHLAEGAVTSSHYAYRVTELMFGGIVVQLTTVLLPVLARELREDPEEAVGTLLRTVTLVSFVTVPTATVLAVVAAPIIGLLFGGGEFGEAAVALTGSVLAAYSFSLVGTGHAKVMASSFFAQKNTRTPMWGSALTLVVFTVGCSLMVGPLGVPGIGWANTVAMAVYAVFLSAAYARRYGLRSSHLPAVGPALARQLVASGALAVILLRIRPWLVDVQVTSLDGAAKLAAVLLPAAAFYIATVTLLGGREVHALVATLRRRRSSE